jgi:hypothetical protein
MLQVAHSIGKFSMQVVWTAPSAAHRNIQRVRLICISKSLLNVTVFIIKLDMSQQQQQNIKF